MPRQLDPLTEIRHRNSEREYLAKLRVQPKTCTEQKPRSAADQKRIAIVSETAFPDILTDRYPRANAFAPPDGLGWNAMSGETRSRNQMLALLRHPEISWSKVTRDA